MRVWKLNKNYYIDVNLIHFLGQDKQQDYDIKEQKNVSREALEGQAAWIKGAKNTLQIQQRLHV